MNKKKTKESPLLRLYAKVCVEITSREDEKRWKRFLKNYFPNHYASSLLEKDLLISEAAKKKGKCRLIGVSPNGYGYITHRLAYYGGYCEVSDFEEFIKTGCYKTIVKQGVKLDQGSPEIVKEC